MTAQLSTDKSSEIQYGTVSVEDTDAVIRMLKGNFFKVNNNCFLLFLWLFLQMVHLINIRISLSILPFHQDEPLNTYLDLGECPELEEYASKSIKDGCSFKAMSSSGEIIGVFLNGIMKRPPTDYVPEPAADSCQHEKFRKVLGLMDLIDTRFSVFDQFPEVDMALDGKILSVDSTYRGKGIANELTRMTLDWMRENRIPLMHVLCSSHFSAQLMKKLQFDSVFVMPLADYMDADGVQVLQPDLPHVQAEVMIKRVEV